MKTKEVQELNKRIAIEIMGYVEDSIFFSQSTPQCTPFFSYGPNGSLIVFGRGERGVYFSPVSSWADAGSVVGHILGDAISPSDLVQMAIETKNEENGK